MSDRACRRCKESLRAGENWRRRRRADRPGSWASNYLCHSCERADVLARCTRVNVRFGFARRYAIAHGHPWGIPFETYRELLARPCVFCGGPLSKTGTGLDRRDRGLGYLEDNVQPACGACLRLRAHGLSSDELHAVIAARSEAA
jgi:hypothetical protein